ncbi:MAG: hypothetical protein ACM3IJ_02745 [Candidatus Levyibacteriota bacterium]
MLKKLFFPLFLAAGCVHYVFAAWYVLHGDIVFTSEIGRDFLLLRELDAKKIVFIGPSSSSGLFHGPLWSYLNYPAYLISGGNPVIVGWWWVVLGILFGIGNYFIGKKLFNKTVGVLFALMSSLYVSYHTRDMYNPHGAMLLIPAFFFFFVRYLQTKKLKFLIFHIILGGCIIQFQMAIGIPFIILSFAWILVYVIREKKYLDILSFGLVPVLLSNFLLFDLRHQFLITKLAFHFLGSGGRTHPAYGQLLMDRLNMMFSSVEIIRADPGGRNLLLFFILLVFLAIQFKVKKYRLIYSAFLYFYVGFFALSMINVGGPLLYFYLFPLFPLVFLIFSSFATSPFKPVFYVIFIVVYFFNLQAAFSDIQSSKGIIGIDQYSWKFLLTASEKIYQGPEQSFGYFVYSPNVVAYEGKYAMWYTGKNTQSNGKYFSKQPVTYLLIAPPPPNNPFMKEDFWIKNQVHIESSPSAEIKFPNGYKILKYSLNTEAVKVPFDPGIDPGLTFR